jgi:hypothetical protein
MSFGFSLAVFIPKGEEEGDSALVVRAAAQVRPLALKNTDNKIICGIWNYALARSLSRQCCQLQRGFVKGRLIMQNVLDLDTRARVLGKTEHSGRSPLFAFFDFQTAFPSVAHSWVMDSCRSCGLPNAFLVLLDNLYQGNFAVAASADGWAALWLYSCGVLQGCPLSGFVFVVATDAMLRGMGSALLARGDSLLRAAADDLGAALQRMTDLMALRPIFKIMQLAAGLTLKAEKCILVPLDGPVTMHKQEVIRGWLRHHCPEWAAFKIVSHSRYLGIIMGPGAGERSWATPLIKYNDRCGAIAASR